jgi:hypothetical protein
LAFDRCHTTFRCTVSPAEPQAMTFDWRFVTFEIPAITPMVAHAAVLASERIACRLDHRLAVA